MKSNTNSVKSFEVDHRTLAPGLYLRQTFRLGLFSKVYIWDLRLVAPQLAQNEALSVSVMHTLEHFLAFHLKQDKHVGSKIISVNAMGCGTGFYIETSSNIGHDLIDALIRVVTLPLESKEDIPCLNEVQCGNPGRYNVMGASMVLASAFSILTNQLLVRPF